MNEHEHGNTLPTEHPSRLEQVSSDLLASTPSSIGGRVTPQSRIAVESLLLSEDAAEPEGRREDEWYGENAAPAMMVRRRSSESAGIEEQAETVGLSPMTQERPNHGYLVVERLREILRLLPPHEETQRRATRFWKTSFW